jgi:tRNA pseudouridine38-40 synthase
MASRMNDDRPASVRRCAPNADEAEVTASAPHDPGPGEAAAAAPVPNEADAEVLAPDTAAHAETGKSSRRTYRLDLDYDGTAFGGWAKQPGRRTVQATLEGALETFLRRPVALSVAGRTDAGVHASAQVASFAADRPVDLLRLRLGLNALLPPDVAVRAVTQADDGFDARAAAARTYRYRLWLAPVRPVLERAFVWHLHRPLDPAVLPLAATLFLGHRDWSALTPSAHEYHHCEREIGDARWSRVTLDGGERRLEPMTPQSAPNACGAPALGPSEWVFEVTAASFLHNMVRVMVGSMVDAAQGRLTVDDLRRGIESGERRNMGQTAPARGLCLVAVRY